LITRVALFNNVIEILFGFDDEILKVIVFVDIPNPVIAVLISVNNDAIDVYTLSDKVIEYDIEFNVKLNTFKPFDDDRTLLKPIGISIDFK
jgi:hypothetical protein